MSTKICKFCDADLSSKRPSTLVRDPAHLNHLFCNSECYIEHANKADRSDSFSLWDSEEERQALMKLNEDDGFGLDFDELAEMERESKLAKQMDRWRETNKRKRQSRLTNSMK